MSFLEKLFGNNNDIIKPAPQSEPTASAPANPTGPGVMIVDDVFSIKGRGTVATGRIESGEFYINQTVIIETANGPIQTAISGIEAFRKTTDHASAGDNVGLLLRDIARNEINRGDKIQVI